MADFTISGLGEVIKSLSNADLYDDDTQAEILYSVGNVVVDSITEEMNKSRFDLKRISKKVKYTKKIRKDKEGNSNIVVTVYGNNSRNARNATVAFVLNYGRQEKYGLIKGGHFWTAGALKAQQKAPAIVEEIAETKLKERGLI